MKFIRFIRYIRFVRFKSHKCKMSICLYKERQTISSCRLYALSNTCGNSNQAVQGKKAYSQLSLTGRLFPTYVLDG